MLDQQTKMDVIRHLQQAQEDLTPEELVRMLDMELSKPEEEMDTALVQDLLELLDEESGAAAVTDEQRRCSWQQITRRLPKRKWETALTWAVRSAAVVVLLIALFFATYQTADALNWRTFLRWMQPFAEVFTLYTDSIPEEEVAHVQPETQTPFTERKEGLFTESKNESTLEDIANYADAPERLFGYPAKVKGIPARFTYLQGAVYQDALLTTANYVFTYGDDICMFKVRILNEMNKVPSVYHYEKTLDESIETFVGSMPVTYYYNADSRLLSASWSLTDAQYSLVGALDQEELTAIVLATMTGSAEAAQ